MSKISYLPDPDDDSTGFSSLWAWIAFWKYLDHPIWPEMTLEDLDGDALETARTRFGIADPRIVKRVEKDGSADGEVWYLIVEASDLAATARSTEDTTL